ncbi:LPXTG cell wall anchor domain-containing protein [Metabacillus sp. FJAT-52054]|uniref:LPXTG cell wall anchor domain-containing protein n=1 Tax=Metabacillus sediminis TaxID=3117746 RepID=A0ABZ2NFS3_9BACI
MKLFSVFIKWFAAIIIFLFSMAPMVPVKKASAASEPSEISLSVNPNPYLFSLSNLKPGDWSTRKIVVKNEGKQAFQYHMSVKKNSGSDKFYNVLDVKISSQGETLYSGPLKSFKLVNPRLLEKGQEETFVITVQFPISAGNEYQKLRTEAVFSFQAADLVPPASDQDQVGGVNTASNGNAQSGLPKTGEESPVMIVFTGILLMTLGFGLFFYKKNALPKLGG